eukprot:18314-Amphidinium_carterae.1
MRVHAFRHQWNIASHLDFNSLTDAEQVLHRALTTYLHMCWYLTVTNYDGDNPPLYPLRRGNQVSGNRIRMGKETCKWLLCGTPLGTLNVYLLQELTMAYCIG